MDRTALMAGFLAFSAVLGVGVASSRVLDARGKPPPESIREAEALPIPLRMAVALAPDELLGTQEPYLLVILRKEDVRTCEDLGRQLRELRRTIRRSTELVVVTDSTSRADVSAFLRREKLAARVVSRRSVNEVSGERVRIITPAALLVKGGVGRGIAYGERRTALRTHTFARYLADLDAQEPADRSAGVENPR